MLDRGGAASPVQARGLQLRDWHCAVRPRARQTARPGRHAAEASIARHTSKQAAIRPTAPYLDVRHSLYPPRWPSRPSPYLAGAERAQRPREVRSPSVMATAPTSQPPAGRSSRPPASSPPSRSSSPHCRRST